MKARMHSRQKSRIPKQTFVQWNGAVLSITVIGLLGVYLLYGAHASSPSISTEAESGTRSSTVSVIGDNTASKGSALRFGTFTSPSPSPTPSPTPTPPPASLPVVSGKNTSYNLGVLVLKYFPLTSNGQNIDIKVTGDVGDPYSTIRQKTIDVTNNLLTFLPKATTYLPASYPGDKPSLTYHVVATKEYTQAVPIKGRSDRPTYPDYNLIMSQQNICNYVDNQGVHEVWLWAYQGPSKPGTNYPYLGIDESKMSSPYGDISNSYRYNDMPVCSHTYVVYTFNYGRGTAEAIHSWGHQIEAELGNIDSTLFSLFQGPNYPPKLNQTGRCGSVHNPPNSEFEYDWDNPTPWLSDCNNWDPNGKGATQYIDCSMWHCDGTTDTDNAQLNWQVWMWQHLPGMNNTKTYGGKQLRNWWDVHGNFDGVMGSSRRLTTT
jgi:hypothetical protein